MGEKRIETQAKQHTSEAAHKRSSTHKKNSIQMKGRVIKFSPTHENINNDLDNFLENVVSERPNREVYIKGRKMKTNWLDQGDYIFFQMGGVISHYALAAVAGPQKVDVDGCINGKLCIGEVTKLERPIRSQSVGIRGEGYNILDEAMIQRLLE